MIMRTAIKRFLSDERGGPLAEFALVIGLLFVFTIFSWSFVRAITVVPVKIHPSEARATPCW